MPRLLKTSFNIEGFLTENGYPTSTGIEIIGVSDSNVGGKATITDYVKGPLPEQGTILLVREKIEGYNCVVVNNPTIMLYKLISYLKVTVGFKSLTTCQISSDITIGKNVVIEDDVEIGSGTVIEHNVVIHSGTKIAKNCCIRSGAIIGGQGYGFVVDETGDYVRQPFIGGVSIGHSVEVGYNSVVVAGAIEYTKLEDGVKLDNQVHIAHDCEIGRNSTVTAGVSFCGYVKVGRNVRLAPNSSVKQRLSIGDNSVIGLGAVVTKHVDDNVVVAGNPAKVLRK